MFKIPVNITKGQQLRTHTHTPTTKEKSTLPSTDSGWSIEVYKLLTLRNDVRKKWNLLKPESTLLNIQKITKKKKPFKLPTSTTHLFVRPVSSSRTQNSDRSKSSEKNVTGIVKPKVQKRTSTKTGQRQIKHWGPIPPQKSFPLIGVT